MSIDTDDQFVKLPLRCRWGQHDWQHVHTSGRRFVGSFEVGSRKFLCGRGSCPAIRHDLNVVIPGSAR